MVNRWGPYAWRVTVIAITLPLLWVLAGFGPEPIVQPLAFNHQLHVDENELECAECHTGVSDRPRATLPPLATCQDCHEDELTGSALESRLLAYTQNDEPIPWQRIYSVPDHVYFSHRRHVELGDIACESCHGPVSTLAEPPPAPIIPISMDGCMDCHAESQVTNDCLACHR